jgi:hypothetical protein
MSDRDWFQRVTDYMETTLALGGVTEGEHLTRDPWLTPHWCAHDPELGRRCVDCADDHDKVCSAWQWPWCDVHPEGDRPFDDGRGHRRVVAGLERPGAVIGGVETIVTGGRFCEQCQAQSVASLN